MNRSNISKQLNYGDLSRFVGKPVGQQFAKKRYAEGETVAEELTESVTYEDINGKKRTYRYNPNTHTKPQPSGRMRRTNIDYTQLANNPGMSIFDRATLVEEPAAVIARQQQNVPVSVTEDFWNDIDTIEDPHSGPMTTTQMLESMKATNRALPFVSNIPVVGGLLGKGMRAGRDATQKEYRDTIGKENVRGSRSQAEEAYKQGYKDDGTKGDKPEDAGKNQSGIAAFIAGLFGGLSKDEKINAIQNKIMMNYNDAYGTGSNLNKVGFSDNVDQGGGWGKAEGSFQAIQDDINAIQAAAPQQRDNFYSALDAFQTADTDAKEDAAIGAMYSDADSSGYFDYMAKGGIAQLSPGGIAPSDKHLDPGSFVISADVVSGVGDGSTESGIERMSGLLGIPLDGSVSGPDGSMLGRVTTADGPVPGTGLSDSVSTVIQDTDTVRLNVGNNPLKQMTPQGKTAARVARDELVVDTKTIANLPQMFMGAKGPDLKQGQQMLTNFMDNVRANKTNTGGKQPGPLVPEGQDVMKGLASLFQRA